jgi:hypothetical protein
MGNNHTSSPRNLLNRLSKDTAPPTQLQTIFYYLQGHCATASMVSFETGIPRRSICRYKRELEQAGLLWETDKTRCEITGFKAWYLTTDPEQVPI